MGVIFLNSVITTNLSFSNGVLPVSLNIPYVEKSITHEMRTSYLAEQIRSDLGGFVRKRRYLDSWVLTGNLRLMGYDQKRALEIAEYVRKCVDLAFARGVFVVSSRVLGMDDVNFDSPKHLVSYLKTKEGEYFDPMLWYSLQDFKNDLKTQKFNDVIIFEIAPLVLRHVRAAFLRGINGAASKVIAIH